ncbi:ATP-dependent DNA helicase PIF1 [Paramuricea clavata]|uniref:ATP-dependent DNA helicase n=1 Tax=Paramuricea clavata TaxID=317549 RepID=A0A6S7GGY3_PARCT|nr:ATP-dependent DNA helicase PIF1 [Paramuricea clavata]
MLFTSWRNEITDLLGNCTSYQQHYLQVKNTIDEQMKCHAMCSEDLDAIQDQLNNVEDDDENYDLIAPGTQNIERQDEDEGAQDLHPEFNENYDLSGDFGIPSAGSNTDGGAGVGKSHLTKCLYQAALKYYNTRAGDDFHQVKILMLAPTGKAAYNIKGNTIHSALSIPACQSLKNYKHLDSSRLNNLRCQLGGLKLIFLDEISMVGSTMFNVQINNRLKDIKGSKEDFGGVSMVVIGDLFQLEPVMDRYIFKNLDNSEYAALAPNKWQDNFNMFELEEIMRQRESKVFAEILNRLREGKHTKDDILKLKERLIKENSIQDPMDVPHLFIQNQKVNEFNERVHNAATGEKFSIKAIDSVIGANSAQLRDKILSQIPDDPRKTKQIASNIQLSVGERTEVALIKCTY